MPAADAPRLLVLRALGLGDLLTAIPALRALRRRFPEHRLTLLTPQPLHELARHAQVADELVDHAGLAPLPGALSGAEVAVNLHGRGPESHRALLGIGPRRLVAFRHPAIVETAEMPVWDPEEHEVARWCRLVEACGAWGDPEELDVAVPERPVPVDAPGATIVHPGAGAGARRWPAERWALVARAEERDGRAVFVTGSPAERPLAHEVATRAGLADDVVLAGRTDLLDLAALVGLAGRVVSGDTGIAHLAVAMRTPSVTLFGPTAPAHWGPPVTRPWHVALHEGGRGDPHAPAPDAALLAIAPADVLLALRRLPAHASGRVRVPIARTT